MATMDAEIAVLKSVNSRFSRAGTGSTRRGLCGGPLRLSRAQHYLCGLCWRAVPPDAHLAGGITSRCSRRASSTGKVVWDGWSRSRLSGRTFDGRGTSGEEPERRV